MTYELSRTQGDQAAASTLAVPRGQPRPSSPVWRLVKRASARRSLTMPTSAAAASGRAVLTTRLIQPNHDKRVAMRSRLLIPTFAVLALGLAACGTVSSSSAGGSSSRSATAGSPVVKRAGPIRIYRLRLSGATETPPGAPNGTGEAVIALHQGSLVCWRFAHLHGFANARAANIQLGANGKSGTLVAPLSTGPRLHHRGCVHVSPTLITAIEHDPHAYYVGIPSDQYPAGAVRARL